MRYGEGPTLSTHKKVFQRLSDECTVGVCLDLLYASAKVTSQKAKGSFCLSDGAVNVLRPV